MSNQATLKEFLDTIDCRITDGSEYCWQCFGPNAYTIESWNGEHETGRSFDVIFDTVTQEVFEMTAHDNQRARSYRWINPDYAQALRNEAQQRKVDVDQAYDDVRYIDLETAEDYYTKARAIFLGQDYDDRVTVPLDLDEDLMFKLMLTAHQRDVTLNQLVEELLGAVVAKYKEQDSVTTVNDPWAGVIKEIQRVSN
jgi:sarcosine oxidase delta subunit